MTGARSDAPPESKSPESKNRALRALKAVKEYASFVANGAGDSPTNDLAKKAAQTVKESALPREESAALLEALLAVVDVASSEKRASRASVDAETKGQAAQDAQDASDAGGLDAQEASAKRRRGLRAFLFCAASFGVALYSGAETVALVAFACCVAILYPELRAFILGLRESPS